MPGLTDEEILSRMKAGLPEARVEIWDYDARLRIISPTGKQWYDGPLDHLRSPGTVNQIIAELRKLLQDREDGS